MGEQVADAIDWVKVDLAVAERVLARGELFLAGTVQAIEAVERRACSTAAIFSAGVVAVLIAVTQKSYVPELQYAGLAIAMLWLVAAICSLVALLPRRLHIPGNKPSNWMTNDVLMGPAAEAVGGECENCQGKIAFNLAQLQRSSSFSKWAVLFGVTGPFLGAIVWIAFTLYPAWAA